jgi:hypothetical protein
VDLLTDPSIEVEFHVEPSSGVALVTEFLIGISSQATYDTL